MALPWSIALDVSYIGQHSWNMFVGMNINAVDFGIYFLPEAQDPTLAASTTPGATALPQNLLRAIKGYGGITLQWQARLANLPLDPVVAPSPIPERRVVRAASTRSGLSDTAEVGRAAAAQRRRLVLVSRGSGAGR